VALRFLAGNATSSHVCLFSGNASFFMRSSSKNVPPPFFFFFGALPLRTKMVDFFLPLFRFKPVDTPLFHFSPSPPAAASCSSFNSCNAFSFFPTNEGLTVLLPAINRSPFFLSSFATPIRRSHHVFLFPIFPQVQEDKYGHSHL